MVLVGSVFPTPPVAIHPEQVVRRCLTIRGVHNYAPRHLKAALDFLVTHSAYPFAELVSPWRSLDDLEDFLASPPSSQTLRAGFRPG